MTEAKILADRLQEVRRTTDFASLAQDRTSIDAAPGSPAAGSSISQRTLSSVSSSSSLCASSRSTFPTSSNNNSKLSTTTVSSNRKKNHQQKDAFRALLMSTVLAQLEYYLSHENLVSDTYVKTLTSLNDGCVPCIVLANLASVKALLWATPALTHKFATDEARLELVRHAVSRDTTQLRVQAIDTATSTAVPDFVPGKTIWAIRPAKSSATGTISSTTTPVVASDTTTTTTGFTNSVLLRDVQPDVTEAQVRDLFENQLSDCPGIISVQRDVANCWLIALDTTTDRDTMLRVVLQLRSLTLGGDYVHARLKASTLRKACPLDEAVASIVAAAASLKTRSRNKKKRPKSVGRDKQQSLESSSSTQTAVVASDKPTVVAPKKKTPPPPSFREDDFPTLREDRTVVWSTASLEQEASSGLGSKQHNRRRGDDDEDDECDDEDEPTKSSGGSSKAFSDAASTATTNSSSMESFSKKTALAGYAAAVLKTTGSTSSSLSSPPSQPEKKMAVTTRTTTKSSQEQPLDIATAPSAPANISPAEAVATVVITPPAWGKGRSFADVASSSSKK